MRTRWLVLSAALLAGVVGGALLIPAPAEAVAKEIIQLQRDVALLIQAQRDLQRSVDEKHAVLKTLVEQSLDANSRLNTTIGSLQRSVQEVAANSGARTDTLTTQVQGLADNLEDVKTRVGKLSQQLTEIHGILQSLDAKLAGGAPMPAPGSGAAPSSGPPPSGDVLYTNALRDFTSGKLDLARGEFLDYLKYYPDGSFASNSQFYLGEILFAQKNFADAIAEYDKVLDNFPGSNKLPDARLKKALALLELGQRGSAMRELREVTRRHPGTEADRRASAKLRELAPRSPNR